VHPRHRGYVAERFEDGERREVADVDDLVGEPEELERAARQPSRPARQVGIAEERDQGRASSRKRPLR
jgi:hypothetical protein